MNNETLLRELRDSLRHLQVRIDRALCETPHERGCSQCGQSLVGKRSDARICGSSACKKSAKH